MVKRGWTDKPLLDCVDLCQGLTYKPINVKEYGLLVLRSSNIQNGSLVFSDCVYVDCDVPESKLVRLHDILICVRNGSSDLIGKSCVINKPCRASFGAFMSVLRGDITGYIAHVFSSNIIQRQINNLSSATINQITKKDFENLVIPIPSDIREQRRIAEVLTDVDSLIESLEKLIAKKKAIKRGAMQELLTGKKRLPGFTGEWVKRSLGDYGTFISGNGFPLCYQGSYYGYPFYKVSDFSNIGNERTMCKANNYISSAIVDALNCNIIPCDSIVFAKIGAAIFLERKRMTYSDCCIDNNMMAYSVDKLVGNAKYLCYLMLSINFGELANATALPSLSSKTVGNITKFFPPTKAEQTAIANVLSDMDSEIAELEKKLSKYRNVKTGMMQTLLTGKIRLPVEKVIENATIAKQEDDATVTTKKGHNRQFDDAVAIAAIVNAFYSEKYPLGRKKVQKLLYLMRRKQEVDTTEFKKKAAGPYAEGIRYKGGEKILKNNGYANIVESPDGAIFSKGKNIGVALKYVSEWNWQSVIDWLFAKFRYVGKDKLEVLATIDMAICDLIHSGETPSFETVKQLIASNKEWKEKLNKAYFSDEDIKQAIDECYQLFNYSRG